MGVSLHADTAVHGNDCQALVSSSCLHALWFDIAKTMVSLYEPDRGRFVALDEVEIARLMSLKKPV